MLAGPTGQHDPDRKKRGLEIATGVRWKLNSDSPSGPSLLHNTGNDAPIQS